MKINNEMIENAYNIAKDVYVNKILGLSDGASILEDEFKWTLSSAIGYIHVFDKMLKGDLYTRTINGSATKYYLQNIFNDYGYDALQKALVAVELHIEYYKKLGPINNIEEIYNYFKNINNPKIVYNEFNDEEDKYFIEGKVKQIFINIYERDNNAREKCLKYYGYKCSGCGLIMSDIYGKIAENFIHVHHLIELSRIKNEYTIDPINDLRPLCPNCHSIIHRKTPSMTIEELKSIIIK